MSHGVGTSATLVSGSAEERHEDAAAGFVGEELARAGCSLLLLLVSPAIAGSVLARHGTPEQKERWLRGIGRGELRVAFAITEPDAGTNSFAIRTSLQADPDGALRLSGHKCYGPTGVRWQLCDQRCHVGRQCAQA